jgi:hypothetical protein
MSNYETNNESHSDTEYIPCIRKGKNKPRYVKLKKYEAKAQKMNLIRSKNYKVIYDDSKTTVDIRFKTLLEHLKTRNTRDWNSDYEYLYTNVYKLYNIEEYAKQYKALQTIIKEERQQNYNDDKYSSDDSRDWEERYGRLTPREGRRYICYRYDCS